MASTTRSRLTRRLPTLDGVGHHLTTWHGWTWHHLGCPCRPARTHAVPLPVLDVRGRGTAIPLALARAYGPHAVRYVLDHDPSTTTHPNPYPPGAKIGEGGA